MTLKSVDLQVLLPKAQEVGRIQHVQQVNEQVQQQSFAAHLLQEAEMAQKMVQNLPQAREGKIKGKAREDKQTFKRKRGQKDVPEEQLDTDLEELQEPTKKSFLGRIFDLKI